MKQISIIGATFYGNRGAEAMLSATIGSLREKLGNDIKFNVFSYYPKRDKGLVSKPFVDIFSATPIYLVMVLLPMAILFRLLDFVHLSSLKKALPESIRALASSKVLICLAGVSFVNRRTKFILFNVATILPAMLLKVPVVKYAQAMGAFNSFINRAAAKFFLRKCRHIFTRGDKTHSYLSELFPSGSFYTRSDDVAFLFRKSFSLSQSTAGGLHDGLNKINSLKKDNRLVVGICPSIVLYNQTKSAGWNYAEFIANLIIELNGKGYRIVLFPNATRGEDMDKTHNNDLPLLHKIIDLLKIKESSGVSLFAESFNVKEIHEIIEHCDIAIVSRFHAMIGALSSSVPVLVIGWSHKYMEVMERFGQEEMVVDYKWGELQSIVKCAERLIAEKDIRSANIRLALPKVKSLAEKQIEYVNNLVKSNL